jgi:hypothetical protein
MVLIRSSNGAVAGNRAKKVIVLCWDLDRAETLDASEHKNGEENVCIGMHKKSMAG